MSSDMMNSTLGWRGAAADARSSTARGSAASAADPATPLTKRRRVIAFMSRGFLFSRSGFHRKQAQHEVVNGFGVLQCFVKFFAGRLQRTLLARIAVGHGIRRER